MYKTLIISLAAVVLALYLNYSRSSYTETVNLSNPSNGMALQSVSRRVVKKVLAIEQSEVSTV
jgi:hypothetical protein